MIVCPLCEHSQPGGDACEVCGRRLEGPAAEAAPAPALEGLEPTLHTAAGAVAAPPLEGLEPTGLEPGAVAAAEPFLDLEPTGAAPVAVVEVAPAPDLEPTALPSTGDGPTPAPASLVCRYCRTPASPGERRCERCGMRLPVLSATAEEDGAASETVRCSCGAPVTGVVCPACGGRLAGSHDG